MGEDLLGDVLRRGGAAGDASRDAVDEGAVRVVDVGERRLVAVHQALVQVGVRIRLLSH